MATARDLIKNKTVSQILAIQPDASVLEAAKLMAEKNIGALLVEKTEGQVSGIITERDLVLKVQSRGLDAAGTPVSSIMTEKVFYVESSQSVEDCMDIMNSHGFRHLPVYENGELLGLISVRDVLRAVIAEQKHLISHLENYINGI